GAHDGFAAIEQSGLRSGRRRWLHLGRPVHGVAALDRDKRQAGAFERAGHHRHAARKRRRSGAGGGKLKAKEESRERKQSPAAADEVSRITPHGLLPTIPVLISRVNPREGSRTASGDSRGARGGRRGALLNPLRKRMIFRWAGAEQLARRFRRSNFPAARRLLFQKRVDGSKRGTARNQSAPRALDEQPAAHFPLPVLGRLSRA